jgi:DNA-binding XRE family transcriptional regulator
MMPRKTLPRLTGVAPGRAPLTLHLTWEHGDHSVTDVSGLVASFRAYAPLRNDPGLFHQVRLGEYGSDIVWTEQIDMSADSLWRLTQEQSGQTLTAEAFRAWRERKAYTLDTAAKALGLSRRMVAYYEDGEKPIPRVVALATRALELDSDQAA